MVVLLQLQEYERKRNFDRTPEPRARRFKSSPGRLRFVIQKHDATRLHYDFRLETRDGVLKSWAVPKGISLDPSEKRLAIMTEDHPGDYIDFEGEIPEGNYGAGTVIVWDTGRYESEKDIDEQVDEGKIRFTLFGEKVKGSFSLIRTKRNEKQWLMIKAKDEHASPEDLAVSMPQSVLSGNKIKPKRRTGKEVQPAGVAKEFPSSVKPMLALPVDEPFDKEDWVFEVKWDGVRAILFYNKSDGILQIRSRKGNDISHRYPEVIRDVDSLVKCNNSAVLDGEIVVLDKDGIPDFQRHQKRMNVDAKKDIEFLSRQYPATYYVFDILYLDGMSLEELDFVSRRQILSRVLPNSSARIRISEYIEGQGNKIFENAIAMKLEGIVAKYKYSKYLQDARSAAWLKIKGVATQDCVVIGYTEGEGNRKGYFGSLILAAYDRGKLRFVGHSGSGFGFDQLEDTLRMMQKLRTGRRPIDHVPYVNRQPVWLRPELVVEVKFQGWTEEGNMRAPIFVRFREDKKPEECIIETPKKTDRIVDHAAKPSETAAPAKPSFSNLDKVFWNASSGHKALTKADLIDYYDAVSVYLVPHLRDRPLSLKRYPDGIHGKSFYHKNWEHARPDYVKSIRVFSESSSRTINYLVCNNRETLAWLANVGCIEMHPWYSRVHDYSACTRLAEAQAEEEEPALDEIKCGLEKPDFIVFDLDPYIYSGKERKGDEPEYNVKGFKAAVGVAYELKELLQGFRIESFVKTSGKTGLHIFVPIAPKYSYDQTREFAEVVGKILARKLPDKITMEWNTAKRKGKVFFDHNQNAKGKTIASVLSARPTASATVSMPLEWKKLDQILPTDFTMLTVSDILKRTGDPWREILEKKQDLNKLLANL